MLFWLTIWGFPGVTPMLSFVDSGLNKTSMPDVLCTVSYKPMQ